MSEVEIQEEKLYAEALELINIDLTGWKFCKGFRLNWLSGPWFGKMPRHAVLIDLGDGGPKSFYCPLKSL